MPVPSCKSSVAHHNLMPLSIAGFVQTILVYELVPWVSTRRMIRKLTPWFLPEATAVLVPIDPTSSRQMSCDLTEEVALKKTLGLQIAQSRGPMFHILGRQFKGIVLTYLDQSVPREGPLQQHMHSIELFWKNNRPKPVGAHNRERWQPA